jgi:epoxyqueuosine reductase
MQAAAVKRIALECGFDLAGIARAEPVREAAYYPRWIEAGMAGEMAYLAGRRGGMRQDPRALFPPARSVICVGKLYQTAHPHTSSLDDPERAWISRYAWGSDYHDILRSGLEDLVSRLQALSPEPFEYKICVDTAPLLERAYARHAGLGWIAKNTCLINQQMGSWFFLGELLISVQLEADAPPPDRCGTCTRCIEACPTGAIVPTGLSGGPAWALDSRLCISYFTIELRGSIPEDRRPGLGRHVFGCDICQDVCPWNRRSPAGDEPAFQPIEVAPPLERLASLSEEEFRSRFRESPVSRARYSGFLRNVAVAMGNSGSPKFRQPLERLARSADTLVAEHARWALARLGTPA